MTIRRALYLLAELATAAALVASPFALSWLAWGLSWPM